MASFIDALKGILGGDVGGLNLQLGGGAEALGKVGQAAVEPFGLAKLAGDQFGGGGMMGGLMEALGFTGDTSQPVAPPMPAMPSRNPVRAASGNPRPAPGVAPAAPAPAGLFPRGAPSAAPSAAPSSPTRNPLRTANPSMGGLMGDMGFTGDEATAPPLIRNLMAALGGGMPVPPVPSRSPGAPSAAPAPTQAARAPAAVPPVPSRAPGVPSPAAPAPQAGPSTWAQAMQKQMATGQPMPIGEQPGTSMGLTKEGEGPSITGKDVTQFFRNVAAGAAGNTNSPVGAFMTGAHGALRTGEKAGDKESASALAADERQFDRRLKTSAEERAQAAEGRASRDAQIANAKSVMEIMRMSDPGSTMDERLKLSNALSNYARSINKDGTLGEEELRQALEAERARITGKPASGTPGAAPAQTPAQTQQPLAAGDGSSRAAPAKPMNQQQFDALPSGSYFVNPKDGQTMRKQ